MCVIELLTSMPFNTQAPKDGSTAAIVSVDVDDDDDAKVSAADAERWRTNAWRLLKSHVRLVWQEDVTETVLAQQIADSNVGKFTGERGKKHVGITFFAPLSGEAVTTPHLRNCPLSDELLRKLQGAALKGRSGLDPAVMDTVDHLQSEDVFIFTDGGCLGDTSRVCHVFSSGEIN